MISTLVLSVILLLCSQYWLREIFFKRQMGNILVPKGCVASPVDGTLVYVREVSPGPIYGEKLGEKHYAGEISFTAIHVGIYMSIFDRHHVVAPCDCELIRIQKWSSGVNFPMLDLHEYIRVMFFRKFENWFARHLSSWITQNERVTLEFVCNEGNPFTMILIGDKYVNKITLSGDVGSKFVGGQKIAFISRGSQTDILFPKSLFEKSHIPQALVGKRVTAGDPILQKEVKC